MFNFIRRRRPPRRTLTRAAVAVLATALLTGILAGPAAAGPGAAGKPEPSRGAGPASATAFQSGTAKAIQGKGGAANASVDGWFAGIVFMDPSYANWSQANRWIHSDEAYTGPGGHVYRTFRLSGSNQCLSHQPVNSPTQGMLFIETCDWWDNSQWWAVDHVFGYRPECPSWPFCPPDVYYDILMPWDAYGQAAIVSDNLILLAPRGGTQGFVEQRFDIAANPKLPA
ncbi:hypothetical protein [Plantactinospora sp. GCM10030261]|uniref:hypothetical protein n=1 Tax=Plantactinospora sp. GCM10030261 TaxID=3273420 RepID=UPI003624197A